jgi:D-alanine-D-alanine ligase
MTPLSLLPKIAAGAGYDFSDLCEQILSRASCQTPRVQTPAASEPRAAETKKRSTRADASPPAE